MKSKDTIGGVATASSPKVKQDHLSGYDALRAIVDGKKMRRLAWADGEAGAAGHGEDYMLLYGDGGVVHIKNTAGLHRMILCDGDLTATDWVVVRDN